MQARPGAFHPRLDSVDTRREQIDERSGNLQLQTTPIVRNLFCGLIGITIRDFLFLQVQYGNRQLLEKIKPDRRMRRDALAQERDWRLRDEKLRAAN
jgi:hypothetical protein